VFVKTNKFFIIPVVLLMSVLTSCASYRAFPLSDLSHEMIQFDSPVADVHVIAKAFTQNDCREFLDRDVIAEGYQPIQLYVRNKSDRSYLFSLNRISLPVARPAEVARSVHTSTINRAVGYGVGALILWPLAIPAVIDGVMSSQANDELDNDFIAKAAKDQIIFPQSRLNAVIFVPMHSYQNAFTLTLCDADSKAFKTFDLIANR
jgi:hypothetical protein